MRVVCASSNNHLCPWVLTSWNGEFKRAFLLKRSLWNPEARTHQNSALYRALIHQGNDPQWDHKWKSSSSLKKRKGGGKKKTAEPQTQEFLTGLPWKLQRRPKILNKVKQNIHWAHHQIADNTKLCPVTITEWWRPFKHGAKYFGEMNSQSQSSFSSSVYTQRYTVTLKVRGPLTLSVNPVRTLQQAEQWKPQFMGDKQCEWLRFSSSRLKPSRLVDLPTPHFFFPISNAKFRLLQLIFLVLNEALN